MRKFVTAMKNLYPNYQYALHGDIPTTETEFNNGMKWIVGATADNDAVYGDKPSDVSWTKVKAEMDKL